MKVILDWLDHRTGYKLLVHEALNEPIPGGARWRYITGSMLSFVFVVQVITGMFLWTGYSASTQTAWESVYYIQNEMYCGWLVRGIHHFAAQAMMVVLALHFLQVIWDGAYRAPREVNFWLGLVLMQIVIGLSLTGYLLPWDQKGYYATKVATNIAGATPIVGPQIQQIAQGGTSYGHHTLTRFFAMHAGLLPALLTLFLGLHVYVFRRHGITVAHSAEGKPVDTFWPRQVLYDAVGCLVVFGVILYFTYARGAELTAPADPGEDFPARPEWYFLFLFKFIEFPAISQHGVAFGAIYIPTALMLIVFLMPFIGRSWIGHQFNRAFLVVMLIGISSLTVMTVIEDRENALHQAKLRFAERDAHRAVVLANREGIPQNGARELMVRDAYTQGPRLFRRHCSTCHRYDGHNGTFELVMKSVGEGKDKKEVPEPATAADLKDFGSRQWITRVLTDFPTTFQSLENAGDKGKRFLEGEMAGWCKENQKALTDSANADSLKALVEFIVAQSGRKDLQPPVDEQLVAAGKEVFKGGALKSGTLSANCSDCHAMKSVGDTESLGDGAGPGYPKLTGYGGREWLKAFIRDPGHADFYDQHNMMIAFTDKSLPESELDLLVDWMIGEYYMPEKSH